MTKNRNFMIVRYLLLGGMALTIMLSEQRISSIGLIFFFAIVISVQLRMYMIQAVRVWDALVLLELLALIPVIQELGVDAFPLVGLAAMEAGLVERKYWSGGYFAILLLFLAVLLPRSGMAMLLLFTVLLYLVFRFLREEFYRKEEAQKLYDQLRVSEGKLQKAYQDLELYAESVEEITKLRERNRISREIHDSVGHDLSTIMIQLGALETITRDSETLNPMITQLRAFSQDSLEHVRLAVRDLKPDEYKNLDSIVFIENLLHQYKRLTGREVIYSFSKDRWQLNDDQYAALYRVIQEFLSNSSKHSGATKINCTLMFSDKELTLLLQDNGRGTGELTWGFGLTTMEERIRELGGSIDIETAPEQGFTVRIGLPRGQKLKIQGGDKNE